MCDDFGELLFEPGDGGGEILGDQLEQAGDLPGASGTQHGLKLFATGHPGGKQFPRRGTDTHR